MKYPWKCQGDELSSKSSKSPTSYSLQRFSNVLLNELSLSIFTILYGKNEFIIRLNEFTKFNYTFLGRSESKIGIDSAKTW